MSFRVRLIAVHEMRLLPEQLVERVAGQIDEGLIGENDRIAAQGGVGHDHRHAGDANSLDEHAALFANRLEVPLGQRPLSRVGHILLKFVHDDQVSGPTLMGNGFHPHAR